MTIFFYENVFENAIDKTVAIMLHVSTPVWYQCKITAWNFNVSYQDIPFTAKELRHGLVRWYVDIIAAGKTGVQSKVASNGKVSRKVLTISSKLLHLQKCGIAIFCIIKHVTCIDMTVHEGMTVNAKQYFGIIAAIQTHGWNYYNTQAL